MCTFYGYETGFGFMPTLLSALILASLINYGLISHIVTKSG
jgi:hypothetical protein